MKSVVRKYSYFIITVVTIILLLSVSYQAMMYLAGLKKQPPKRPQPVITRSVLAETVTYGAILSPVFGNGRVVSTEDLVVSSEVRGRIIVGDIPFKKGQRFKKGAVLIKIFDGNAVNNLKSRKSGFLQRIAGILPDVKVDYPDSYARWMEFFNSIDLEKDLPSLPGVSTNQEKIFLASRNILSEYYTIKSEEITLGKHTIRAPFNGTFIDVFMEAGAIANPGATLAKIVRTDKLELEVPLEVVDAQWVSVGDEVQVSSDDNSLQWTGNIVRKADFIESATQSQSVYVRLTPTGDMPMFKGQYLKAVFNGREIEGAMEIPRNAVFNHNEVFIVKDGRLAKREVNILKINEKTLIFNGLDEGAEVVTEPLINAVENTEVDIIRG
ncbi:efflux RND transporter periplasmic adaptor subunit [Candidatus Latescibacterota bacterium]